MNLLLRTSLPALALASVLFGSATTASGGAHNDFEVGLDPGTNKLLVEGDEDLLSGAEKIELFPGGLAADPTLFFAQEPGWEAVEMDEPGEIDAIDITAAHQISLERVSFDAGFRMFQPPGFAGDEVLTSNGAQFQFVQENPPIETGFHNDLFFAANGNLGDMFSATYQLTDPSGIYMDSDPFTLNFEIVPEPGVAALLVVGGLVAFRRRTRKG